ncbi:putative ankyrin repeat protein RF_0381 [Cloeon dipterum]|uniref:putative ankyrin repeat protein RF_0381 n=1 Tax=Cloeon dipterum TaxID=197152 RepID=UPI00322007AE
MDLFMGVRETDRFIEKTTTDLTLLMLAARDENLESCLFLLEKGESAEARTKFGVTPLHFAALNKENGFEFVWHLTIQKKLILKEKDVDGEEAIFYAVRKGNFRVAQVLLELREETSKNLLHFFITQNRSDVAQIIHAWNPNLIKEVDSDRRNALHLAAQFADLSVCRWIIAQGVDVESKSCFGTGLHRTPLNKNHGIELVRFFVSKNLKLNEKSEGGLVPLDAALAAENIDIARELLRLGATLNIKDHNFLLHCVFLNKLKSAKFIHELDKKLIRGRDANERDALHIAAEVADIEMCQWLVENGVPVDSLNGKSQTSVLHRVGYNSKHGTQLVQYFIDLGLDIDKRDHLEFTPLNYALGDKNFDVAEEMLKLGANFYAKNDGMNTFHTCILENNLEGVQFVLSKVPEIINSLGSEGTNALHIAAAFANLEMCQWLCRKSFDVLSLSEDWGNTVLHFASMNKKFGKSLVPFFVSKGVDVNEKNFFSLSPLFVALKMENIAVAEELLKAGADLNTKQENGDNFLHSCARNNKLLSAKFVVGLNEGLVREPAFGGITALHMAAQTADLDFCKYLVEKGADVRAKDFLNRSVLVYVPEKNKEKRKYFLSLGVRN